MFVYFCDVWFVPIKKGVTVACGFEAKFVKLIKRVLNFEPFMTSSKQKHTSAKMTFFEELRDIQNYILGKSQELNSSGSKISFKTVL